jgi:hypothetical protein
MKTNPNSRSALLPALSVLCFAVLLVAFWVQRADLARMRKDLGQLQEQNAGLQKSLASSRVAPEPAAAAPAQEPAAAAPAQEPVAPHPPVVEPNRLALASSEVTSTPEGLVATLRFTPSKTGPLGLLAVAVRMPRGSDVKILGLAPVGSAAYADFSKEISEDGRFAFFQGTLGDEREVQLALSVSGPTTASVKATCGIKPFELAIQAPKTGSRKK